MVPIELVKHDERAAINPYDARRERHRGHRSPIVDVEQWQSPQQEPPPDLIPETEKMAGAAHAGSELTQYLTEAEQSALERLAWRLAAIRPDLGRTFRELARQWREDTLYISSITDMATHPAYQRIIGMGPAVLPLLLRELQQTRDH